MTTTFRRAVAAAAVAALSATAAIVSAGDHAAGATEPPASAPSWSYTDGSGSTVTLDAPPERLVMHASSAAALIPLGVRPVGIYADGPVADDLALRDLDLDGIEIVGEEWGVINVEAVAALEPDLIIAEWWPLEEAYSGLEEGVSDASGRLTDLAPVAGPAQGPSIATMIEDYEELAVSLGADLDSPAVARERERFDEAVAAFQEAVAAKPGLDVVAVSPTTEGLYVAVPEHAAELSDFTAWGLEIVVPAEPDPGFEYWQMLSWENADLYQADLVIVDERGWPDNVEQVAAGQPIWNSIPAVAAGQVAVWPAFWLRNHGDYADALERLTDAVDAADADLVP